MAFMFTFLLLYVTAFPEGIERCVSSLTREAVPDDERAEAVLTHTGTKSIGMENALSYREHRILDNGESSTKYVYQ